MARYTTRKMRMSCGHVEEWTQIPGTVFPEAWEVCDACSVSYTTLTLPTIHPP